MTLVVHVVEETYSFPEVGVGAAQTGEMLHGIGHGIAMLPQAFGLDPFMEEGECALGLTHEER
jgi:hypothetical protein